LKFIRTFQQTTLAARLVFQTRGNIRESIYRVAGHFVRAFPSYAGPFAPHPAFGPMTRREWMTWGYRHADHHFRQFGI